MPTFIAAAQRELETLDPHDPDRIILAYLLRNAIGLANAKTWPKIQEHLREHRITNIRCQAFQNGLLRRSREGDFYIGSTDRGGTNGHGGYFIIETQEDVFAMWKWFTDRMEVEEDRIGHLLELAEERKMMP